MPLAPVQPNYIRDMVNAPLLSIVVTMFNSSELIGSALRSIYNQGFENLEVVIVDDASSDQSLSEAKRVPTRGIQTSFVSHQRNLGAGPARNSGVAVAEGEFIVFVDSDDQLLPGSLSAIAAATADKELDLLLLGSVERKRGRDKHLGSSKLLSQLASDRTPSRLPIRPELFFWPPTPWAKAYRKEFLLSKNIQFPPGLHQDIPWTVTTLLEAGSIGAVDHPCYLYIRRGEGSSATRSKGIKTLVRIEQIQRIRNRHNVADLSPAIKAHLVALVSIHLVWANRAAYRTMPDELQEQFYLDSAQELSWWWQHAQPGPEIDSDALLSTHERVYFSRALLTGSYSRWQRALATHQDRVAWCRRFDISRYGLFKRR